MLSAHAENKSLFFNPEMAPKRWTFVYIHSFNHFYVFLRNTMHIFGLQQPGDEINNIGS